MKNTIKIMLVIGALVGIILLFSAPGLIVIDQGHDDGEPGGPIDNDDDPQIDPYEIRLGTNRLNDFCTDLMGMIREDHVKIGDDLITKKEEIDSTSYLSHVVLDISTHGEGIVFEGPDGVYYDGRHYYSGIKIRYAHIGNRSGYNELIWTYLGIDHDPGEIIKVQFGFCNYPYYYNDFTFIVNPFCPLCPASVGVEVEYDLDQMIYNDVFYLMKVPGVDSSAYMFPSAMVNEDALWTTDIYNVVIGYYN